MRQHRYPARFAYEKHSHPELGVASRSGGQESWLSTDVFRWWSYTSAPYHIQRLGLQMVDNAMENCIGPDAWPEKYIRNHVRSSSSYLMSTVEYPYSMTSGFYFRTTFGYSGNTDISQDGEPYVMAGVAADFTWEETPEFIGVHFGDWDWFNDNYPQRMATDAVFMVRQDGVEKTVPAFSMRNWEEGHVMTIEIETVGLHQVRLTLTDLNNGDTASHTFDSEAGDPVPDSNKFGTYEKPLTLRPWFYVGDYNDWSFVRWDSVESAYAPWERYEAE